MQHNFVLGAQGSLDALGAAADVVARSPNGLAQQYVPDSPQVLFSTKLLEPGQTVTFQFKAPADAGQVSVRLHVPGALEDDERRAERRRARGPGPGRAVGTQSGRAGVGQAQGVSMSSKRRRARRGAGAGSRGRFVRAPRRVLRRR